MALGKAKKKTKIPLTKAIVRGLIIRITTLLVMVILLFQLTTMFNQMIFVDRLDETGAIAVRHSFQALAFELRDVILSLSGQKVALLNITFQNQTYCLYSENFVSDEIENVGTLEKDGQTIFTIWPSEVQDRKEYVIYGRFADFYRYGTREPVSVLLVEDYHAPGLWDNIISENDFLLYQVMIVLTTLTAACVLTSIGITLWFGMKISELA